MGKCVSEINDFLHYTKIYNNDDKTKLLLIGCPHQLQRLHVLSINVVDVEICAMDHVKNLVVIFDKGTTWKKKSTKCPRILISIYKLINAGQEPLQDSVKTAVNSLVTPHFGYGDGLLHGARVTC